MKRIEAVCWCALLLDMVHCAVSGHVAYQASDAHDRAVEARRDVHATLARLEAEARKIREAQDLARKEPPESLWNGVRVPKQLGAATTGGTR